MGIDSSLSAIDEEIARLQKARSLLSGIGTTAKKNARKAPTSVTRKRTISAKGRKAVAAAQRKRWAAAKAAQKATKKA